MERRWAFFFFLQPRREPTSLYDSPFVCAVAEREAVGSHHSCRTKFLLRSSGLVGTSGGSCRQSRRVKLVNPPHPHPVVRALNSASSVRKGAQERNEVRRASTMSKRAGVAFL